MRGTIRKSDGIPFVGVHVHVFDKDVRGEEMLGSQMTDSQGRYEIHYSDEQFTRAEKKTADLVFHLLDTNEKELTNFTAMDESGTPLTKLDVPNGADKPSIFIKFNAPLEQTVDFSVIPDLGLLSEYERLTQQMETLLVNVKIANLSEVTLVDKLADLKSDEIDFLSKETAIDLQNIEFLVISANLQKKSANRVPAQAFYGLARIKGLTDFRGLASTSAANLRTALIQAGGIKEHPKDNIIPPFESEDRLNEIVESIHQLALASILTTPQIEGKSTLAQVLAPVLPLAKQQMTLLQTFANHEGTVNEYWDKLRQHPDFQDQGKVEKVQFTLQLGALTQNNLQLMNAMQNKFQSTRQVARFKEEELKSLIKQAAPEVPVDFPGGTKEEKLDLYARTIIGIVQGAFPTETVAQVISKVTDIQLNGVSSSELALFLNRASDPNEVLKGEEFDIRSTHIDSFVSKHGDKIFAGLTGGINKAGLIDQLKRAQRLFQVSTSPETFQVMIESKLNSASDIAKMPVLSLTEIFGDRIDAQTIDLIHQRGMAASAASLHIALQVYQSVTSAHPMVVGAGLKEVPNWAALFGSVEMCDCEQCRSVYSPAAYFVDLLEFLRKSSHNEQGWTPLDVLLGNFENPEPAGQLLGKRPDLAHIPLTCENTNTPIPYIDLVNEILESYVVIGGHLDQSTAKDTGDTTAEELSSNPQYVEEMAYDKMRDTVFPISLPFDRSLETARLYLSHLGSSLYDLIRAFGIVVDSNQLASEYLGLIEKEFEIFTAKNFKGQPSLTTLGDLYIYKDENLTPTLDFKPTFTSDQIMSGIAVAILQAKLNTDDANFQLTLTGNYDQITQDSVKKFQQKHGLISDGIVDANDWTVLSTIKPDTVGAVVTGVPEFLNRTKLSYIELVELLKTRFVNPNQQALVKLESAGITYKEIRDLIQSNFTSTDATIHDKLTKAGLNLIDVKQLIEQHLRTIVLYSEKSDCDLSATLVEYLNGDSLDDGDLWKIQRFIRLWHKVGWTMPELDAALISLGYIDQIDEDCIKKLAQIKEIQAKLNMPFIKILSLWADIDSYGENSLYKKLFLNKAIPKMQVDVFQPKPDGTVLDGSQIISAHIPSLLAAFQISTADLDLICTDLKLDLDNALLTLANVSSLYRYGTLAKALKLKIEDLIALKTLNGRGPFQPKTPAAVVAFMDVLNQVRSSDFSVSQLNYLYRHIQDPKSGLVPQQEEVTLFIKNLQEGLQKIAQDNMLVPDTTGELTRNRLATTVDPIIADQTIQIVLGTYASYTTSLDKLPMGITFDASVKNKISHDQTEKKLHFAGLMTQAEQQTLINASAEPNYQAAVNQLFQQSTIFVQQSESFIKQNLSNFLITSDAKIHLLHSSANAEGKADAAEVAQKFAYILKNLTPYLVDKFSRSLVKQKLSDSLKLDGTVTHVLLEEVLKAYTDSNKHALADFLALVGDGLSAAYFNNAVFTGAPALVRIDPTISFTWGKNVPDASINQPLFSVRWTGKLLAGFDETYTFYLRSSGNLQLWVDNQAIADQGTVALRAGQLYDIKVEYARVDTNIEESAELQWSSSTSTSKAVISQTNLYSATTVRSFDLPLKSYYLLHKISLLVNTLKMTAKELAYLSFHPDDFAGTDPTDPSQKVSFDLNSLLPLDPSGFKPAFFDQWRRLAKLFALKDSLQRSVIDLIDIFEFAAKNGDKTILSREIIKHLVMTTSQNSDFIDLLSKWVGVSEATLKQVLKNDWTGLSDTAIKTIISDQNQTLAHFVNLLAKLTDLQVLTLMLATATGWDINELTNLILTPQVLNVNLVSFKDERSFLRIQACIRLIQRLGISAGKMFIWATQAVDPKQANEIKNTVKAKYDDETWLKVAKPLSDKLRESQRAALIAYVLTMPEIRTANVTDSDRLFEYFLIDVEMGACMCTSRIKQAISSIQLFVQRCLLNLEPHVPPTAINVVYWQWMTNYRVWEANRKVFLYPENWIEPDLRDDKSPFFQELESELLQNDLTNDVAEKGLLNYLYKLDQVAQLEICGMYLQEDFEQGENYLSILHVFGRTMGGSVRSYYYRRLIDKKSWTPWEKVEVDINGLQGDDRDYSSRGNDPLPIPENGIDLLPVVWNRRLYLFWLILTKRNKQVSDTPSQIDVTQQPISLQKPQSYWEIKLAWSKYDNGKWKPKQISENTLEGDYYFYPNTFRLRAYIDTGDGSLELRVFAPHRDLGYIFIDLIGKYRFDNYNDNVREIGEKLTVYNPEIRPEFHPISRPYFMGYIATDNLTLITYPEGNFTKLPILGNAPIYSLLPLNQYYPRPLSAPYFYQDKEGVYFVRSREYTELIVNQVENADHVFPQIYERHLYSADNIRDQLHPTIPDPVMEKAVINPWISAEEKLAPQKLKMISDQSGVTL